MIKINSLQQLKAEKRRMRLRQEQLEDRIKGNWSEFKTQIRPGNLVKDALNTTMKHKVEEQEGESLIQTALTYGISLLVKKFTDKAGDKFSSLFKRRAKA